MSKPGTAPVLESMPRVTQKLEVGSSTRCSKCFVEDAEYVCAQCGCVLCAKCICEAKSFTAVVHHTLQPRHAETMRGSVFCSTHWRRRWSPTAFFGVALAIIAFVLIPFEQPFLSLA